MVSNTLICLWQCKTRLLTAQRAANRVEWFRGRERYRRWEEEEMILRREMATVLFDFEYRCKSWMDRSTVPSAKFNSGYVSYCLKQAELWRSMRKGAFKQLKDIMIVRIIHVAHS